MAKLYTTAKIVFLLNRIYWVSNCQLSHVLFLRKCSHAVPYSKSETAMQIAFAYLVWDRGGWWLAISEWLFAQPSFE